MKDTTPYTVPDTKKDTASNAALPRPDAGDPGGIRTPDTQFRRLVL